MVRTGGCRRAPCLSHSFRWTCHAEPCKNPERRQKKSLTLMDTISCPWTSQKVNASKNQSNSRKHACRGGDWLGFFSCFPFSSLQPFLQNKPICNSFPCVFLFLCLFSCSLVGFFCFFFSFFWNENFSRSILPSKGIGFLEQIATATATSFYTAWSPAKSLG